MMLYGDLPEGFRRSVRGEFEADGALVAIELDTNGLG